ncbi:MAG: hypothetical protein J6O51_05960 [Bacteroidales bacterium]|nr:hypothetical protein [Bacteroidales bacterium]
MQKRYITIFLLFLTSLAALPLHAQRKVSADVQVKTVINGKVSTVTKSIYCNNNGRLVTSFKKPTTYYVVTNSKGEMQFYYPATNEVYTQIDQAFSSTGELVWLFMSGRIDDLGLGAYGLKQTSTSREDGYIKKTFSSSDPTKPVVEIVYENYLPIYCAYTSPEGKLLSKKYLSDYQRFGRFTLPLRVVDINYGSKKDSSVVRTLYSSIKVDEDAPEFSFEVPSDATPLQLPKPGE